ncbi:hypothetical protein CLOP_g10400, partial [Closterium sp. NIES-67]
LFGTDLPSRVCSLNESQVIVDTNCFTSPCNFAQEQREESDCTATCGLVPPSTLPCGGRGYCNWDMDRSQAKCACDAGSAYMTDHAACVTSTGTPWHASQLPFLKELRTSWKLDGRDAPRGWQAGDDCKTAEVLTCDDAGMITQLMVLEDVVSGEIPESVGDLAKLSIIVIRGTGSRSANYGLTGAIPESISQLTGLVELELSNVRLIGDIPSALFTLPRLTRMVVGGYDAQPCSIPQSISQLSNLVELELSNVGLTDGGVPSELFTLTDLTRVIIRDNGYQPFSISEPISQLINLAELELSNVELTDSVPPALITLTHLTRIIIRGNSEYYQSYYSQSFSLTQSITQLANLADLELSSIDLTDSIPSELFTLTHLTRVVIRTEDYSSFSFPASISQLTNLVELELARLDLTGGIPSALFDLTHLTRIRIEGHFDEFGSIPQSVSQLTSLVEIDLSKGIFTGGIPSELFNLGDLTSILRVVRCPAPRCCVLPSAHVDLRYNNFFGPFPDVKRLDQLSYLDIAHNFFAGKIPTTDTMSGLEYFNLKFNYFTSGTIGDHICNQAEVSVASNCLDPDSVLCQLDESQLQDCYIFCGMDAPSSIPPCDGHGYCYGENLNIPWGEQGEMQCQCAGGYTHGSSSTSCVSTLQSSQVEVLNGLLQLWGSAPNSVWQSETIDSLKERFASIDGENFIVKLDLSSQTLSGTIPSILTALSRLTHLDLSHNDLSGEVPQGLSTLLSLHTLDLSYNQLSGSIPPSFIELQRLQTLDVRNNYLYSGTLPATMCTSSALTLSLQSNCFPSNAIPCALVHTQRPSDNCSAFCHLSPSTPPCADRGHCYWDWVEGTRTAMCACEGGYGKGVDPATCASLLSSSEWAALETLSAAWGGFDGFGTWKNNNAWERMSNIICDSTNHVMQLNVSGLGIRGFIPDAISALASLTVLDLSQNYLTGTLPKGLSILSNLKTLNVRDNYLYAGSLPTTMCTSSALTLSLQSNCFPSNAIPCPLHSQRSSAQCSTFCGLSPPSNPPCSNHGYCYWDGGEAAGKATCACKKGYTQGNVSSTCVSLLPKLEWLALEGLSVAWDGFDGSGTWDKNIPCKRMNHVQCDDDNHIVDLDVSRQSISGSIPTSIQGLSRLTSLNMSNNAIAGPIPDSISRLTSLQYLDLSYNQLSGALPSGLNSLQWPNSFQGRNTFQGLRTLDVSNNYLYSGGLNKTVCKSSAGVLSLQGNCFPPKAIPCGLRQSQSSEEDCYNFCQLTPPTPPCPGLGYCYWAVGEDGINYATCACGSDSTRGGSLGACDGLPTDSEWAALAALRKAWQGYDGLGTWKKDHGCDQMEGITCDYDNHVVSLDLSNSDVSGSIPSLIGNLIYLTSLNLGNNRFSGTLPTTIGRLTNLVEWDLQYNDFTGNLPKSISAMQRIGMLNIAQNTFAGSIPDCMSKLAKLKILDMHSNSMSGQLLSNLKALKQLNYLDLSYNGFSGSIPSRLTTIKALRTMNLDYNKLSGTLAPLPRTVSFSARYNYLSGASTVTCKKSRLEQNCLLGKQQRVCSGFTRRPLNECTPFCGLSSKRPPCGGRGACVLEGAEETPVCYCDAGYANGEIPFTCIPEDQSYPQTTVIIDSMFTLTNRSTPSRGMFFSEAPLKLFSYDTMGGSCGREFYFKASFSFMMIPKTAGKAGNGLAFVVSASSTIANSSSGVGYAGMDQHSMAVEFDTWLDKQDSDTSANHVGVNLGGSPKSSKSANVSDDLNDGRMYSAWVEYTPGEFESLKVFASPSYAQPAEPLLSMSVSLCDVLLPSRTKNSFYFGFVAASTVNAQEHLVATTTIETGFDLSSNLPTKQLPDVRATGLVVTVDTYQPNTTSPFTRYVSVGYSPAQDGQDSWNIPTLSTWTIDPTWVAPDQGDCSDCWAYAVVASIEAAYGIAVNSRPYPSLSINSLFDVTNMTTCESGSPTVAFQILVASAKGLKPASTWDSSRSSPPPSSPSLPSSPPRSSSFLASWLSWIKAAWHSPSLGKTSLPRRTHAAAAPATGSAPPPATNKEYKVIGFERAAFKGYFGLMLAVRRQPVVVHIEATTNSFINYNGLTRYNDPECYMGNLNHVVLVTGYVLMGTDKERPHIKPPFWRVRNSWGMDWGEKGYIHMDIAPGDGICGINVLPGIYPIIRIPDDPCMVKSFKNLNGEAVMNPCGSFKCTVKATSNTCECTGPFVQVPNADGSQSCAYVDACGGSTENPCEVGSCINDGKGKYTCVCPPTYTPDTTIDGFPTCTRGWGVASKLTVAGSNWQCADVHSLFGLTLDELNRNNQGLDCAGGEPLQENQDLIMTKANVIACSAFYYTLPSDTCSSIDTYLKLRGSLETLNPDLDCSDIKPSRSLCIERSPIPLGPVHACRKSAVITTVDDCTQAGNAPGSGISMVDLYRMNPGLVCDPAKGLKGGAGGSMKLQVCVDAEYLDYSVGRCVEGKTKYFKADTPCVSILAKEFKGKRADFEKYNKRKCATTIGGKPGTAQERVPLCIPP